MRNFKVLETFRFIAAIIVALGHFFYSNGNLGGKGIPKSYILSVEFFFVLSGFLITLKLEREKLKIDEYLNKFFWARTIRLLLPYMILISIYHIVFIKFLFNEKISLYNWIINLFLLQILGLQGPILGNVGIVAWALGVEYWIGTIYFPIILFLKRKFKKGLFFLALITYIVSIGILRHYSETFMDAHFWTYSLVPYGILRILASYSIGVFFSICYQSFKNINLKYKKVIFNIIEIFIIYIIVRFYSKINYNRENEYIFPIIVGILIMIYAYEIGFLSKILKNFSNLGKLSFSIYLIHQFFNDFLTMNLDKPLQKTNVLLYLLLVIITSFLFYYFVEKNIIKLKYHIVKQIENKD